MILKFRSGSGRWYDVTAYNVENDIYVVKDVVNSKTVWFVWHEGLRKRMTQNEKFVFATKKEAVRFAEYLIANLNLKFTDSAECLAANANWKEVLDAYS